MLPGFEEALIGAKAGDEKHLKLTFPADLATKSVQANQLNLPSRSKQFIKPTHQQSMLNL